MLNTIAITPKSEDKYVVKVFNGSEVHLSEMTCYKIHTLMRVTVQSMVCTDLEKSEDKSVQLVRGSFVPK